MIKLRQIDQSREVVQYVRCPEGQEPDCVYGGPETDFEWLIAQTEDESKWTRWNLADKPHVSFTFIDKPPQAEIDESIMSEDSMIEVMPSYCTQVHRKVSDYDPELAEEIGDDAVKQGPYDG